MAKKLTAFFQGRYTVGQQVHEKRFNITDHQENGNQITMRYYFTHVRMAIIKKIRDNQCW